MTRHTRNKRRKLTLFFSFFILCFLFISAYVTQKQSYNNTQNSSDGNYVNDDAAMQPHPEDSIEATDLTANNNFAADENFTVDNELTADIGSTKKNISDEDNNHKKEEEEIMHPDRVTYCEGFFYEPLTNDIIKRIDGISYHENDTLTYEDLNYLNVQYYDFNGQTQTGELICNRLIAQDLMEIFKALYDASYPIEKIRLIDEYQADDDASCADNNTSCFNYRVIAGSDTLSKHALGMAVDINPFYNPYITYPDGQKRISPEGSEIYEDRTGGYEHMIIKDDLCYRLFIEHGFTWGGEWKTVKDYQHFQKTVD